MSLHNLFPQIKLEPKPPNRLLSLWNPADYARLYFWLLHDPFTLDAYAKQFAAPPIEGATVDVAIQEAESAAGEAKTARAGWLLWLQTALLLGLLILLSSSAIAFFADSAHVPAIAPEYIFLTSFVLGEGILLLVFLVIGYLLKQPAGGVLLGFCLGLILAILEFYQLYFTVDANSTQWFGSTLTNFNLLVGTSLGIMLNTLIGLIRRNRWGPIVERVTQWLLIAAIAVFVISYNRGFSANQGLSNTLQNIVVALVAFGVGLIRPLDWLYGSISLQRSPRTDENWAAPRVTLLPTANLQIAMDYWLSTKWDQGIKNLNQIWQYTNLRGSVQSKLESELQKLAKSADADITDKVAGLLNSNSKFGWTLDDLLANYLMLPAPSYANLRKWWADLSMRATPSRIFLTLHQATLRPLSPSWHGAEIPLNDRVTASLAGFHYLRRQNPSKAKEAFQKAGNKGMAKEMTDLCTNLENLLSSESWLDRSEKFFRVEGRPDKPKREDTWNALAELKTVLDEAWLYRRCAPNSNNLVPLRNSVYGRLAKLQEKPTKFEEDELIKTLAHHWIDPLNRWFDSAEKPEKLKAIDPNPYRFDSPLNADTKLLIGSKDNLAEISAALERSQPILLYGQPGMGKTSLLIQLQKQTKNKMIPPIIIDLAAQNLLSTPTSKQVLKMIGQEISRISDIKAPDEHRSTYLHDFHDFLVKSCAVELQRKFIVVIDRFELALETKQLKLKQVEEKERDIQALLHFLSNITILIPNFRVIYVGHCLPKEILKLLLEPTQVGMRTKKLTFLDEKGTKNLLNSPLDSLIARFQDDAVTYIYQLTNGQPFLVQLIASQVIQKFNERQKSKEDHPDPVFTSDKVDEAVGIHVEGTNVLFNPTVVQSLPFWKQAKPFLDSLSEPIRRLNPQYQDFLRHIATEDKGWSESELIKMFGERFALSATQVKEYLNDLEGLDLLKKEEKKETQEISWQISIELLRIYLLLTQNQE